MRLTRPLLPVVFVVTACGGAVQPIPPADTPPEVPSAKPPPDPPVAERGFLDLDPRPHAKAKGHMFYVFFPADEDAAHKPLFVFFNGGPGFATTLGLLADGTAPTRVDESGAVVDNAASFTSIGSLLYLDQRQTGLSYDDAPRRSEPFDMMGDAEDFTRGIVRFLDAHEALRANKVVLVAESYGGTRAQLVLSIVLNHASAPASRLRDELQAHFDGVLGGPPDTLHGPETVATQFAAQVLIEPAVLGQFQLEQSHAKAPLTACGYDTRHDEDWCRAIGNGAAAALADPERATRWLGGPLASVAGLRRPERHGFRVPSSVTNSPAIPAANAALVKQLGALDPGDAYLAEGPISDDWATDTTLVPPAFVRNLRHVRTLITHAIYDEVVDTHAIPAALAAHGVAVAMDTSARDGEPRPGRFTAFFTESDDGPAYDAEIRFPTYEAGHMVTLSAGKELRDDVLAFLREAQVVQ